MLPVCTMGGHGQGRSGGGMPFSGAVDRTWSEAWDVHP